MANQKQIDQKARYEKCLSRLKALYPDATIETTIDETGNIVWETNIPGDKTIQSMNLQAIETFLDNRENQYRRKLRGL